VQFPDEAARLKVLWQSELVPHGVIVLRASYPPALRRAIGDFLLRYGRGGGPQAEHQRAVLRGLHDFAGFLPADNRALAPVAALTRKLALDSAQSAQWINDAARQARLRRIETDYAEQMRALMAD
jgi:phosphonate transport system substrate-binding protein